MCVCQANVFVRIYGHKRKRCFTIGDTGLVGKTQSLGQLLTFAEFDVN